MRREYDLTKLKWKRNPYARRLKKSVTIRLDEDLIRYFVNVGATPPLNPRHLAPLHGVCSAEEVHDDDGQTKASVPARGPDPDGAVLDSHPGRLEEERTGYPRILSATPGAGVGLLVLEEGTS